MRNQHKKGKCNDKRLLAELEASGFKGDANEFRSLVFQRFELWMLGNPEKSDEQLLFNPERAILFCNTFRNWDRLSSKATARGAISDYCILKALVYSRKARATNPIRRRASDRKTTDA